MNWLDGLALIWH